MEGGGNARINAASSDQNNGRPPSPGRIVLQNLAVCPLAWARRPPVLLPYSRSVFSILSSILSGGKFPRLKADLLASFCYQRTHIGFPIRSMRISVLKESMGGGWTHRR